MSKPNINLKSLVIAYRLRGLKTFDIALKHATITEILDETVKINTEHPNTWGPMNSWDNIIWAFGNAWRGVVNDKTNRKGDISSTFNLDEALSVSELQFLIDKFNLPPYTPENKRKD